MDYQMNREMLLEEIVDYGNEIDCEIESNLSSLNQSSIQAIGYLQPIIQNWIEMKKLTNQWKYQIKKKRTGFIKMFSNWSKYINQNQIYMSMKLLFNK